MIGYNPSHLNTNETLLEAFHRVEAYLKANPQYQVYQSSATYQEGTQEYTLDTIVVPEGSTVGAGDVVLFSNVYYAVITSVSETTFSIATATNFRGAQGEQGPKGDTGATGEKGETGLPALMYSKNVIMGPSSGFLTDLDGYNRTPQINDVCLYVSSNTDTLVEGIIEEIRPDTQQVFVRKETFVETKGQRGETGPKGENGKDGNATLLYAGELSESITTAEISQITRPKNRGILVKDILISTATSTFGAMAQVTALPVGVTTVDVSFIGTLESGGSGVSNYNDLANIPVINQDLSASGFIPVANTYYRHTGATTDTFTQGVIYLYDTAYHKLGESGGGGGTTLNKYTAVIHYHNSDGRALVSRILQNAKSFSAYDEYFKSSVSLSVTESGYVRGGCVGQTAANYLSIGSYEWNPSGSLNTYAKRIIFVNDANNVTMNYEQVDLAYSNVLHITYYNDTEIT